MTEDGPHLRRFQSGERIVIREVLHEKIWTERPVTVIEDSDHELVTWLAPGTIIGYPDGAEHGEKCLSMWLSGKWSLADKEFSAPGILRIAPHAAPYEVFVPITSSGVKHWYVNLEQPLQRTEIGFDTMDEILDLVVAPDLHSWERKDADELELATTMGIFDESKARQILETCRSIERFLEQGVVPWNQRWASWRPTDLVTLP